MLKNRMSHTHKLILYISVIILLTLLAIWNSYVQLDNKDVTGDAFDYLSMAYNYYKHKVFSLDNTGNSNPPPTVYREPAYPAFLALSMAFNQGGKNFNISKPRAAAPPMINLVYDLISKNIENTSITIKITFKLIGKGKCNVFYEDRTKDGWEFSNKMVPHSGEWITVENTALARDDINAAYAGLAFWPESLDTRVRIKNVKITSKKKEDSQILVHDRFDVWTGPETFEAVNIASSGGKLIFGGQDGEFEISPGREEKENYYEVQLTEREKNERKEESIKKLKSTQIAILVIISFLTAYIVFIVTRKILFSFISLIMTMFSITLTSSVNELLAELFTALLVLCAAILLYNVLTRNKILHFVLLGAVLGCLVLTRAIFFYFIFIIFLLFIYLFCKRNFTNRKFFIKGCISFLLVYSLIIGSWMMRNFIYFEDTTISLRGGVVLSIRANYNMMNKKEFWGSFLYWMPESTIHNKLFNRFYSKNGDLVRLNRGNPSSYYRSPDEEWAKLLREYSELKNGPQMAERELRKRAIKKILDHPFRHIATTFPFAWRGHFVERGYQLNVPFSIKIRSNFVVNILYFTSLFFIAFISWKKKNWPLFAFCLPALYLFVAHSFLTHNEPRFNIPLIPIIVTTFLISTDFIISYWEGFKSNDSNALTTGGSSK